MNTIAGKFSTKGMIMDICSMRSHAFKLLDSPKSYSDILQYLIKFDFYDDDNFIIPNLKMIEQETGFKYSKIRKQIELIYSELSAKDYSAKIPFEITELEVVFYLRGYKESTSIVVQNLSKIPQIDEEVRISFFNELTGSNVFHVTRVEHYLIDSKQQINIVLEDGYHNSYLRIRKDMAYETGELNYFNTKDKSEYQIKEMLQIRRGHVW